MIINEFRRKIISNDMNEDMNDIIKIKKSLEDSDVIIDGNTKTVKHEVKKKKKADFLELC